MITKITQIMVYQRNNESTPDRKLLPGLMEQDLSDIKLHVNPDSDLFKVIPPAVSMLIWNKNSFIFF